MTGPGEADSATREIDADGLLLTPGWVDVHTHYDAQASWDPYLTPSSWHGVTTAVMGNCGVGFAPAAPDRHEWLIELMEGVEDIPGSAMTEGITWEWESFEEFLDALDARHYALDLGAQIAHGPVRGYVMGDRGAANEPATPDDITAMSAIVEAGLRAGALGFSTSRTPLHKSLSGELVPGTHAGADELLGIADALARVGHGVFQFAPEHADVPTTEMPWMRELARRTGRTVSVNLNQPNSAPDLWREVLAMLDESRAEGLDIVAQVAGRVVGLLMCLEGSFNPLDFHPAYGPYSALPLDERVRALQQADLRAALRVEPDDGGLFRKVVLDSIGSWWAVDDGDIDYEPEAADSIAAVAQRTGTHPIDLIVDQLCAHDGHGMILTPFFNYAYGDLSFQYEAHQHPSTRMGLADAGAHCRVICDGGTPTFMLTHWTPRPTPRADPAGRTHRASPDPPDRRAVWPPRSRSRRPGHAGRPEPHRLRPPDVRPAPHGLRPPGRRPPAGAEGRRLRRDVRQRRPDRRRRRVHGRPPRPPDPRSALTRATIELFGTGPRHVDDLT